MDTRLDFQRLLEDMDKVIQAKRLELSELDERLESARSQLSEEEARDLLAKTANLGKQDQQQQQRQLRLSKEGPLKEGEAVEEAYIQEQRRLYERQLERFGEELTELESINQELGKANKFLRLSLDKSERNGEELAAKVAGLQASLEEVHSANLELNLRLAYAESEQQLQQKLLKKTHAEDEVLMAAMNDKLESFKRALETKDEEIKRLRVNNRFLLESLGGGGGVNVGGSAQGVAVSLEADDHDEHGHDLIDSDNRQRVIEIAIALREKDSQIELLKSQLLQATQDLERNAALIEGLNKIKQLPTRAPDDRQSDNGQDQMLSLDGAQGLSSSPSSSLSWAKQKMMLEQELEAKDKQLNLLEFKNHHYETILPTRINDLIQGLANSYHRSRSHHHQSNRPNGSDASVQENKDSCWPLNDSNSIEIIRELSLSLNRLLDGLQVSAQLLDQIDRLKSANEEKGAQIERLVKELNQFMDEEDNNNNNDNSNANVVESVPKPANMALNESLLAKINSESPLPSSDQENSKVEAECQAPDKTLINQTSARGTGTTSLETDSNNTTRGDTSENSNKKPIKRRQQDRVVLGGNMNDDDNNNNNFKSKTTKVNQSNVLPPASKLLSVTKPKPGTTNDATTATIDTALLAVQGRLRHLENENELLELAMKEILLSLKWTDSQCSTILIDCPSLERLCQLIEARFIARGRHGTSSPSCGCESKQDLFQLVVLKSELDLVRGHNEQLRFQLKSQRRDYIDLLAQQAKQQQHRHSEMACQTEDASNGDLNRCKNCARLANLTNHLLQCIVRVEGRVNAGDELYARRLAHLHKLVQLLERDLAARERHLNEARRECHQLGQLKLAAESRLHYLEGQLSVRHSSSPNHGRELQAQNNLQVYTKATTTTNSIHQSLTISKSSSSTNGAHQQQVEPRRSQQSARLTISLLQSIISCLQARLDYKDERLQQLERLLMATHNNSSSASSPVLVVAPD